MRCSIIFIFLFLLLAGCQKDKIDEPVVWFKSYENLDTELIFEEEFDDLKNWKVDTSWVVRQWVGSSLPTGNACKIYSGSVFLKSTVEIDYYPPADNILPVHKKCIIQKDLGSIPAAKRYLLEIELIELESYHYYTYSNPSKHETQVDYGGTEILLTINGKMHNIFGSNNRGDGCQTSFNNTTFKLIIDTEHPNNAALVNGEISGICFKQEVSTSAANSIMIRVNPHTYGSSNVGFGNITTQAQSCTIGSIRLSKIL